MDPAATRTANGTSHVSRIQGLASEFSWTAAVVGCAVGAAVAAAGVAGGAGDCASALTAGTNANATMKAINRTGFFTSGAISRARASCAASLSPKDGGRLFVRRAVWFARSAPTF